MSEQRQTTLQNAVKNIFSTIYFSNRWTGVESIEIALKNRYKLSQLVLTRATISRHIGKMDPVIDNLNYKHTSGIYRCKKRGEIHNYFQSTPGDPPYFPPFKDTGAWELIDSVDQKQLVSYLASLKRIEERQRPNKRKYLDSVDIADDIYFSEKETLSLAKKDTLACKVVYNYWNSPEAVSLFSPNFGETVLECLIRRDKLLLKATIDDSVLYSLIRDFDENDKLTDKQITKIRYQCIYLRKAYEVAIQYMNGITWVQSIRKAIEELSDQGIIIVKNDKTIRKWNVMFRTDESFLPSHIGSEMEPKVFTFFPDCKKEFLHYCNSKAKIGELSTEAAYIEIKNRILPNCYSNLLLEYDDCSTENIPSYDEILKTLDLKCICFASVNNWLKFLGFSYSETKQCYYTDVHEREDVVKDREERFLGTYYNYEIRSYRWIQITDEVAVKLEEEHTDFPKSCYYQYSVDGRMMREYHIDTHDSLSKYINSSNEQYGGNLSTRLEIGAKPLMLIGQDESTYHQFVFSKRHWKPKSGMNFILPKSTGEILMISGFQSREFGLGLGNLLTNEILSLINNKRKGQKYLSAADAVLINNNAFKPDIADDPTLRFLRQGLIKKVTGQIPT